jgi:hypothetical protein
MIGLGKILIIVILFQFLFLLSNAQDTFIKVLDNSSKRPIEYCTITCSNNAKGGFTNIDGLLKITDLKNCASITVNAIGYKKRIVDLTKLQLGLDTLYCLLTKDTIQLNEIKITPNKDKAKKVFYNLGHFKSKNEIYDRTGYIGRTDALYIPNLNKSLNIKIEKLLYSIDATETAKVRLQIFTSSNLKTPGTPLINDDLVIKVKKGAKKIVVDVSKYNLIMPEDGLFISLQWLGEIKAMNKTTNINPIIKSHRDKDFNRVTFFKFLDGNWEEKYFKSKNGNIIPNFGISVTEYSK